MGKRTWIDSDIWSDVDDLNNREKMFYIYLLTNGQRNIAGYYKINLKYVASDLGTTVNEVEELMANGRKYWDYDPETKQVLIPKFTRYNLVKSRQQCSALNAELEKLKPCRLHKKFLDAFVEVNGLGAELMLDGRFRSQCEDNIYKEVTH